MRNAGKLSGSVLAVYLQIGPFANSTLVGSCEAFYKEPEPVTGVRRWSSDYCFDFCVYVLSQLKASWPIATALLTSMYSQLYMPRNFCARLDTPHHIQTILFKISLQQQS